MKAAALFPCCMLALVPAPHTYRLTASLPMNCLLCDMHADKALVICGKQTRRAVHMYARHETSYIDRLATHIGYRCSS